MNRYHGFRDFLEKTSQNHGSGKAFLFEDGEKKTITWNEREFNSLRQSEVQETA